MPAPTAAISIRTGTPDGTNGEKVGSLALIEDSSIEVPFGIAVSDMLANAPSAHRSSGSVDSDTDMSSAGFGSSGSELTNNRGALVVWVEFATAAANCTLVPVFYDNSGTPAPQALGPTLSFTATTRRVSSSGNYMSQSQIIDTHGFRRFKMFKETISSGNIVVHAIPV